MPKVIFFENVKGFTLEFQKNKDKGKNFSSEVIKALEDLEYDVYGKMMDFSNYGIPQTRKRFILVGIRKDVSSSLNIRAEDFFTTIEKESTKILAEKGLKRSTTILDAISDLEKGH
jgi:DNA (cytosine-5)-methyltransferase 1